MEMKHKKGWWKKQNKLKQKTKQKTNCVSSHLIDSCHCGEKQKQKKKQYKMFFAYLFIYDCKIRIS